MGIKQKILIGVIVAAGVTFGTYATLTVVRNKSRKPVKVYKMSEVAQTDYWADSQDNYGTVSSDQVQNVFLTNTQTVKQVFVQKGQYVKAGDPLLAYDTTLSQINIERAENDVNQQKRTLDLAKKELAKMQKTKPIDAGGKTITPSAVPGGKEDPGVGINPSDEGGEDNHHPENPADYPADESEGKGENGGDQPEYPQDDNGGKEHHAENGENGTGSSESSSKETIGDQLDINYQGKKIGEPHDYDAPALLDGVGTVDRPGIWLWSEKSDLTEELLKQMFNETMTARKKDEEQENTDGKEHNSETNKDDGDDTSEVSFKDSDHDCYIVLRQYMENNPSHKRIAEHGLHLSLRDGTLDVSLFNPDLLKVRDKAGDVEEASESGASSIPEADNGTDISESGNAQEDNDDGQGPENFEDEAGTTVEEDVENTDEADGTAADDPSENEDDQNDTENDSSAKQPDGDSEDYASMTRAELAKAINDQKNKIRDQTITEQLAEVKLRQMKHELSDGIVRSRIDGVVKTVRDPNKAYEDNKACVSVSNGGGMSVTCAISELALSKVKKDMPVTVTSQESDNTADGKVTSVSTTPVGSGDSYGSSNNPNVSYYTCKVQIPGSADFKEHEFVSVSFGNGNASQHGLFLDGMFIRSDENGSYVYIKGKDGKLEKRYIKTGRDIGGGTMEILRGISIKDRIAFPYGSSVAEGAKTKNASTSQLYGEGGVG